MALAVFIAVAAQASHAEQAGCSPQRASTHIGVLEASGVVEKRTLRRWVEVADRETGEIMTQMQSEQYLRFVQPAAATLQTLTTIAPEQPVPTEGQPKPKTWGGSRRGCLEHPEAGTIMRWTRECLVCGQIIDQGEQHTGTDGASLTLQDERSAIVDGTDARATEDGGGHVLAVRHGRSDAPVPPYHGVPAVHTMGDHDARSDNGADASDGRTGRGDDDG